MLPSPPRPPSPSPPRPQLDISYDSFIRTTDAKHEGLVAAVLERVWQRGDIYKADYEGYYCVDCEEYKDAADMDAGGGRWGQRCRGTARSGWGGQETWAKSQAQSRLGVGSADQCGSGCARPAGADNTCPIHRKPCVERKEENYFFALSKYQAQLEELCASPGACMAPGTCCNGAVLCCVMLYHCRPAADAATCLPSF